MKAANSHTRLVAELSCQINTNEKSQVFSSVVLIPQYLESFFYFAVNVKLQVNLDFKQEFIPVHTKCDLTHAVGVATNRFIIIGEILHGGR